MNSTRSQWDAILVNVAVLFFLGHLHLTSIVQTVSDVELSFEPHGNQTIDRPPPARARHVFRPDLLIVAFKSVYATRLTELGPAKIAPGLIELAVHW